MYVREVIIVLNQNKPIRDKALGTLGNQQSTIKRYFNKWKHRVYKKVQTPDYIQNQEGQARLRKHLREPAEWDKKKKNTDETKMNLYRNSSQSKSDHIICLTRQT